MQVTDHRARPAGRGRRPDPPRHRRLRRRLAGRPRRRRGRRRTTPAPTSSAPSTPRCGPRFVDAARRRRASASSSRSIDTNLFGMSVDTRLSAADHADLSRLIELGQPMVVFIAPAARRRRPGRALTRLGRPRTSGGPPVASRSVVDAPVSPLEHQQIEVTRGAAQTYWHRVRFELVGRRGGRACGAERGARHRRRLRPARRLAHGPPVRPAYPFEEASPVLRDRARPAASAPTAEATPTRRSAGGTLVAMLDVLEHIEDDHGVLADLLRRMDPGSHLVITVPAMQWAFSSWDTELGHFRRYSRRRPAHDRRRGRASTSVRASYLFPELFPLLLVRQAAPGAAGAGRLPRRSAAGSTRSATAVAARTTAASAGLAVRDVRRRRGHPPVVTVLTGAARDRVCGSSARCCATPSRTSGCAARSSRRVPATAGHGEPRFVVVDDSAGTDHEVAPLARRSRRHRADAAVQPRAPAGDRLRAALPRARTSRPDDVVVTMDSDGEDQPADLPRLRRAAATTRRPRSCWRSAPSAPSRSGSGSCTCASG